ncbi:MAG: signal peptidase II [Myxococcales bacterium]|nr:signal peptidase II [Myxococcales bacterium]
MHPRAVFGITALVGIAIDQLTKRWVAANLELRQDEIVVIPELLSIVHVQNIGAAFSILEGQRTFFLLVTAVAVVIAIGFMAFIKRGPGNGFVSFTLGLVFSGIVGNGLDRLIQGYVTDMVMCYAGFEPAKSWLIERFGTHVYPIWNVADACLVVGVTAFLLSFLFQGEREPLLDDEADSVAPEG